MRGIPNCHEGGGERGEVDEGEDWRVCVMRGRWSGGVRREYVERMRFQSVLIGKVKQRWPGAC